MVIPLHEELPVTFRDECLSELGRLQEDAIYTEKAHFAAAGHLLTAHYTLGVIATLGSAVAATTIVGSMPEVAGIAAGIATLSSAVLTFVKPEARSQQHLGSGRKLGGLRVRMRQIQFLDMSSDVAPDPAKWRGLVADVSAEKADIDAAAPNLGAWAFSTARRKIHKGDFEHEADA